MCTANILHMINGHLVTIQIAGTRDNLQKKFRKKGCVIVEKNISMKKNPDSRSRQKEHSSFLL